jgi:hypothetical protein
MKSFAEAKAILLGRHQQALVDARTLFDAFVAAIDAEHREHRLAAEAQWDQVKSGPADDPAIHTARAEYERSLVAPDHEPARAALAKAVFDIDNSYHSELRRIAAEHGVQMSAAPLTTRGI